MLARADRLNVEAASAAMPAAVTITVEQFPGLCMGVTVLMSLSLHKVGMTALTEPEADALTKALLKNAQAWELDQYLENPKLAAALDLGGCLVAIMVPRIIADARKRPASPTQQAAAADDALAAAA